MQKEHLQSMNAGERPTLNVRIGGKPAAIAYRTMHRDRSVLSKHNKLCLPWT